MKDRHGMDGCREGGTEGLMDGHQRSCLNFTLNDEHPLLKIMFIMDVNVFILKFLSQMQN